MALKGRSDPNLYGCAIHSYDLGLQGLHEQRGCLASIKSRHGEGWERGSCAGAQKPSQHWNPSKRYMEGTPYSTIIALITVFKATYTFKVVCRESHCRHHCCPWAGWFVDYGQAFSPIESVHVITLPRRCPWHVSGVATT